MKILYFDVFAGISGDMCLGSLVDLGCPIEELKTILTPLKIPGFNLESERVSRGALSGTKVHVHVNEEHHVHRNLSDMLEIANRISWPGKVQEQIIEAFTSLAKVEGYIHNKPFDQIHFHEVGSYDAVIDICGTFLGMHLLGIEEFACSKIHIGEGFVKTHHGLLPLPCPAAAQLLEGFTTYSTGRTLEMVTPTGAAILKTLTTGSSIMPEMKIRKVGYGAGDRNEKDLPNLLRVFYGEDAAASPLRTLIIETNIDDMNPEFFEPLMEKLFHHGALDVTLSPIMMKKNRPATQLSVIAAPALKDKLSQIILQNSSAIGLRFFECERFCLEREIVSVETLWGPVKGKVIWGPEIEKRFTPEYEECKRIHREQNIPMQQVYQAAIQSYQHHNNNG